jgi:predicted transcriptional regulator
MDDQVGLDKLFFELASESRLGILFELQTKNLKMQEVAQKLSLTHTEVFRQLQRLSEALLIEKKPEGTYAITQNGKLLLELSRSFEFVSRFRRSLLSRDLERIPYQFIDRLGELSQAKLSMDTNEMINNAEQLILGAEKYLWLIGQTPLSSLNQKTDEVSQKGVQVKLLFDENSRKFYDNIPEKRNFEKRVVPTIPAIMLINEKMAGINILPTDKRGDSMVLYGSDPKLLKWANDVFLYFWEQGKRCFPV